MMMGDSVIPQISQEFRQRTFDSNSNPYQKSRKTRVNFRVNSDTKR